MECAFYELVVVFVLFALRKWTSLEGAVVGTYGLAPQLPLVKLVTVVKAEFATHR